MSNTNYSYITHDIGYNIMHDNIDINRLIPLKADVEPRIIYFLRTLYYHKKYRIKPCVPIYMQFHVKTEDWDEILRYVYKYNIRVFKKIEI